MKTIVITLLLSSSVFAGEELTKKQIDNIKKIQLNNGRIISPVEIKTIELDEKKVKFLETKDFESIDGSEIDEIELLAAGERSGWG